MKLTISKIALFAFAGLLLLSGCAKSDVPVGSTQLETPKTVGGVVQRSEEKNDR